MKRYVFLIALINFYLVSPFAVADVIFAQTRGPNFENVEVLTLAPAICRNFFSGPSSDERDQILDTQYLQPSVSPNPAISHDLDAKRSSGHVRLILASTKTELKKVVAPTRHCEARILTTQTLPPTLIENLASSLEAIDDVTSGGGNAYLDEPTSFGAATCRDRAAVETPIFNDLGKWLLALLVAMALPVAFFHQSYRRLQEFAV